ncbi:MAG: HAMP domain-containing sensor histidine kinase [Polyangiaceae bacterium]
MALRDLVRSRLALRFMLVGLAQMIVVALGFAAIMAAYRPPGEGPLQGALTFATEYIGAVAPDRAKVGGALRKLHDQMGINAVVYTASGEELGTTLTEPPPWGWSYRPPPKGLRTPEDEAAHRGDRLPNGKGLPENPLVRSVAFPDGQTGTILFLMAWPPPPPELGPRVLPLVLLVVAVSSLLMTWSFTGPLRRMSRAAQAFGQGDLSARSAVARRDELGEVSRAFDEMAERVTALLRAEKELLANVSHELRTPLTRIRIALDIAAEGDADAARESLADIAGDLDELERLISDILTAARLDLGEGESATGTLPLRKQRIDVAEMLDSAASRFRASHPDRPLDAEVAPNLPAIEADPVLLRRVVDNLLENAHKYTERKGASVSLTARREAASVRIEVADRGIGIAAADLPKIFRPFFRADRSRTRATGGLGLGLALAKRIVEAHDGEIHVESKLDEGTKVCVTLPAAN